MRFPVLFTIVPLLFTSGVARGGGPAEEIPYGHDFVVLPECPETTRSGQPQMEHLDNPYRLSIFLNFEGAKLSSGGNDAANNLTDLIAGATLDYPAMTWTRLGGREQGMADLLAELKLLFLNYSVDFVTQRPASGEYTMAMIGGSGEGCSGGGDAIGVAPLDCKNSRRNEIVLIFGEKVGTSAKQLALVIAHELGHSFGLEHVADRKSVMYPALNGETCCWTTSEVEAPSACGRSTQDDAQVLMENLGAGPGDAVAPRVWFLRPGPGAVLPPNFGLEVVAADDLRVHHVTLFVDGVKKLEVSGPPYALAVTNLSDGEHTLRAEVADWKPNVASTELRVSVQASCVTEGSCYQGATGLGGECSSGNECSSGLCAKKGGAGVCASDCPGASGVCPAETTCQQAEEDWFCVAGSGWAMERSGEGGGCSLTEARGRAWPALAILGLALSLTGIARRRRR